MYECISCHIKWMRQVLYCITTHNFKINFRIQKATEKRYLQLKVTVNGTNKTLCLFGKYNLH